MVARRNCRHARARKTKRKKEKLLLAVSVPQGVHVLSCCNHEDAQTPSTESCACHFVSSIISSRSWAEAVTGPRREINKNLRVCVRAVKQNKKEYRPNGRFFAHLDPLLVSFLYFPGTDSYSLSAGRFAVLNRQSTPNVFVCSHHLVPSNPGAIFLVPLIVRVLSEERRR